MTATALPKSPAVTWSEVTPDLWSAIRRGQFHGTIERSERGFAARDSTGALVAEPATLQAAQRAVDHRGSGAVPARPWPDRPDVLPAVAGLAGALALTSAVAAVAMLSLGY